MLPVSGATTLRPCNGCGSLSVLLGWAPLAAGPPTFAGGVAAGGRAHGNRVELPCSALGPRLPGGSELRLTGVLHLLQLLEEACIVAEDLQEAGEEICWSTRLVG